MTEHPFCADELVAEYWPPDGPHTSERAESAADVMGELVRYLNHATLTGVDALPDAPALYQVVGALAVAAGGLDQTLRQLRRRCDTLAADPTLRHAEHDEPQAATVALSDAQAHLRAASPAAAALRAHLAAAQTHLAWLHHQQPADTDGRDR